MVFKTHTEHIQKNTDHDKNIKFLIGGDIEEKSCNRKLKEEQKSEVD